MAKTPLHNARVKAFYFVLLQAGVVAGLAFIIGLVKDFHAAYSALLGGMVSVIANAYYATKVFSPVPSSTPRLILKNFYRGEINKLLLTAILLILIIKYINIIALPFLCTYIAAQFIMWFALLRVNARVWTGYYECK